MICDIVKSHAFRRRFRVIGSLEMAALIAIALSETIVADQADPYALNFHLMHPGGDSKPGDPNAAFYLDGTYHLHYILAHDWSVDGKTKKGFSFIHVTSPDMLHWTWQKTQLQPSFTGHGMYSGTGFLTKEGLPAIIYHGAGSGRNQIAIAKDRRLSAWNKPYPVEPRAAQGESAKIKHWDPDCFRIGDTYYAISGGLNPPLLKSDDLKHWTHVGDFLSHEPDDVAIGEDVSCANFFPLGDDNWMLLCISHTHGCRYYLGEWDSEKEQFVPGRHARMNWPQEGQSPHAHLSVRDCFAPESVETPDGRRVMWAWLATLDERLLAKTIQSLPRELRLADDGSLRIRPLRELNGLRYDRQVFENFAVPTKRGIGGYATKRIFEMNGDAWELRLTVSREEAMRKRFGLRLFADSDHEGLPIMIQPASGTLRIGTAEVPFAVADLPEGEDLELRIFIDNYLVEVFVNERQAHVAAHLDGREVRGVDAYAWSAPITFEKIELWKMKSTNQGYLKARQRRVWEPEANSGAPGHD